MTNLQPSTIGHYESQGASLEARVRAMLDALGDKQFAAADLATFDQFHVRGLAATAELGELAGLKPGMTILDAGSGLGGPSRYLAETYGVFVKGVDLAASYVDVAALLAERAGLGATVNYERGDIAQLRVADASIDLVWTQHVMMNVSRRDQTYGEFHRVLRPGGALAFYDVLAAEAPSDLAYPVPWAETAASSFLLTADETRATLTRAGFQERVWRDATAEAAAWFAEQRGAPPTGLSLAAAMGPRFGEMARNLARNVGEGRVRLVMAVFDKRD